jgi:hypothetical protein
VGLREGRERAKRRGVGAKTERVPVPVLWMGLVVVNGDGGSVLDTDLGGAHPRSGCNGSSPGTETLHGGPADGFQKHL